MTEMGWTPTLLGLGIVLSLLVVAERRARRPFDPSAPDLVPWRGVILLCGVLVVVLLAHVVTLATGTPLAPRWTGRP